MNLDHVTVVLQKPRYPENIGSAARALRNMGLGQLRVVAPENFDLAKVRALATHAAADVVDRIRTLQPPSARPSHRFSTWSAPPRAPAASAG